jgi:hypothetical protein
MAHFNFRMITLLTAFFVLPLFASNLFAQNKSFKISVKGDTINRIDNHGLKQGKWVVHVDPLRGESGYEEEGLFVNDKKEGPWRRYTLKGDLTALENYQFGGKDGKSQYFTALGDLVREENWRAYNPDAPYDTIPIYGTGSNEILSYKIVKAEQYSVKNGDWTYYDPSTGMIIKVDKYDRGRLMEPTKPAEVAREEPMKKLFRRKCSNIKRKTAVRKK